MALTIDLCGQMTRKEKEKMDSLLLSLYQERLDSISSRYYAGGLPWVESNRPDLYRDICRTWDRLNDIWNRCFEGMTTEADFKSVLNRWYELQMEGIKLYKPERRAL